MGQLELILDKVKQSDLENFRKKVEPMEAATDQFKHSQGHESIEDVVSAKEISVENRVTEVTSITLYDREVDQVVTEPVNQEQKEPDKATSDIFEKFLQSIRG